MTEAAPPQDEAAPPRKEVADPRREVAAPPMDVTHPQKDVAAALDRWQAAGLLDAERAAALRAEAAAHAARDERLRGRYVLAATAAFVLLLAAGALASWAWPLLGEGARAVIVSLVGVGALEGGRRLDRRGRWLPAATLLEIVGLVLLLGGWILAEQADTAVSAAEVVVTVLAIAVPLLTAPAAFERNPLMAGVRTALGFAYLAAFLSITLDLPADTVIWTLDAVLVGLVALLGLRLWRMGEPEDAPWAVPAFAGALYAGLALAVATGVGPLALETDAVWAVDLWLAVVTGVTLWARFRAPRPFQSAWLDRQLALCALLAIPLGFATLVGSLGWEVAPAGIAVAAVGGTALAHGLHHRARPVTLAGAFGVIVGAWAFAVESAGALGAVAALALTAALFFWLSGRTAPEAPAD